MFSVTIDTAGSPNAAREIAATLRDFAKAIEADGMPDPCMRMRASDDAYCAWAIDTSGMTEEQVRCLHVAVQHPMAAEK